MNDAPPAERTPSPARFHRIIYRRRILAHLSTFVVKMRRFNGRKEIKTVGATRPRLRYCRRSLDGYSIMVGTYGAIEPFGAFAAAADTLT